MTETTPGLGGLLYAISDQHARRLEQRDVATTAALAQDWAAVEQRALADLAALQETVDAARAAGRPVSPAWLYQQARLETVLDTVQEQVQAFAGTASARTAADQAWAQGQAQTDAANLTAQAAGVDLLGVNPANVTAAAGFLADGSPVADLFAGYGRDAAAHARAVLTQAAAFGWGADRTAREFTGALGMLRSRAQTIARTELHRVYRTTSRDTYMANADVVTGWTWRAHLDGDTCPACAAMDGTVHPVTEALDGHPRCRCAMVPLTPSWADLGLSGVGETGVAPQARGEALLAGMTPREQDRMLGPTKAALYRQGQIALEDCVVRTNSARWGTMRREATVAEARANAAARGVRQRVSKSTPRTGTAPARRKTATEMRAEAAAIREQVPAAKAAQEATRARVEQVRAATTQGAPLNRRPYALNDPTPAPADWHRNAHTTASMARVLREAAAKPVKVNVSAEALESIARTGRIRTAHEASVQAANSAKGRNYLESRQRFEHDQVGIPRDTPADEMPVYGWLDSGQDEGPIMYGGFRLILDDAVKARTSLTGGDSLLRKSTPMWVDDVADAADERLAAAGQRLDLDEYDDAAMDRTPRDVLRRWDYVEAQVHGGVRAGDIRAVVVESRADWEAAPQSLRDAVAAAGWEVRYGW